MNTVPFRAILILACFGASSTGCAFGERKTLDAGSLDASADATLGTDAGRDGAALDSSSMDAGPDASLAQDAGVTDDTAAWVLTYFGPAQDLPNDSLHLAYSTDGLHWRGLAPGQPTYQVSGIGSNHIRDPYVFRRQDGTFVYIATDWTLAVNDSTYWGHPSPNVLVAESADLITFTNPHLLRLTNLQGPNGSDMHAWAPEAYYDAARGEYAILWSGNDTTDRNRIYVSYTSDFETVDNPTPDVFFDPGYSVIDGTLARAGANYYLVFKDATSAGQDIQIARSSSFEAGTFVRWDPGYIVRGAAQTTQQTTEGPFVVKDPTQNLWYTFADFYAQGGVFGCWSSPSLDAAPGSWTRVATSQYSFPPGVRHANTVRVTQPELDALIAHYGVSRQIRTSFVEGGYPFYVAHSWFHGVIARLNEPSLASGDNEWVLRAGLSDATDPELVSFEASGFPGSFVHVDSANVTRYPPCGEASTYGWALCNVPAAERNHLTWIDTFVASPTFRSDATFRRVPALNGDPSMVSFQWVSEPTRYLRHASYQLFVLPVDGSTAQNADASFSIE